MMGNTLSGSIPSFPLSLQSQTWLVYYTWDVVPETVGTHSCPRDVTEQQPGGSVGKPGRGPAISELA